MGFFGFKHDRKLALKALAVAAARNDTHSVFAGSVDSVSLFRSRSHSNQACFDDLSRRCSFAIRLSG